MLFLLEKVYFGLALFLKKIAEMERNEFLGLFWFLYILSQKLFYYVSFYLFHSSITFLTSWVKSILDLRENNDEK